MYRKAVIILLALLVALPFGGMPSTREASAHPAAPVYQNLSEAGTASASGLTIIAPAGFSAGDLFIVFITKDDDVLINEDGDWTTLHRVTSGGQMAIYCAWRIAEVGDTSWTWTGDSEAYYGAILRYTGHDIYTPILISDVAVGTSNTPAAPSVETTRDDCMVFQAFGADDDDEPYTMPGAPFTQRFNDSYTTTGGAGGDWVLSSQGATGTGVFGMNAIEEWGAVTVAIQTLVLTPTVTTQAVAEITKTTAIGHGTIVAVGQENCSKRGICWNTGGNPTVADDKSEETDSFGTGAFSRSMIGLSNDTHYYARAYAYNSAGYGYGNEVEFDTLLTDIDVGAGAIARASLFSSGRTLIDKNNPANASGTLHTVEVRATQEDIVGLIVGTFYLTNGNTLKCRDSVLIGDVARTATRTFTGLSINVQEGDYIGCYYADGYITKDSSGFAGVWGTFTQDIDPGNEAVYTFYEGDALSLYGCGDFEAPTVTTQAASSIEETTATLSGNITDIGSGNATDRGFQWDIDSGIPYADNWTEAGDFGVGVFNHGIIGLTKGELYFYIAGANNTMGWGWGSEVTFLTKPDEPNTLVATPGDTWIFLEWNKGTGADNTTITGKIGSYPANRADGTVIYDDTGTSCNHTGLGGGESWYYRAWSWCTEGGKTQYSDTYAQANATTTAAEAEAPTVTTLAASSVEETSATLSGNITDTGGENADHRGFQWDIDTGVPYVANWTEAGSFGVGNFTHGITGLTRGELYYYIAGANNTAGWGWGSEITFLTKPDEPTALGDSSFTNNSIFFEWTTGTGSQKTMVRYRTDQYPTDPTNGTQAYFGVASSYNITALDSGQIYYVRTWSYATEGGKEQYSDLTSNDTAYTLPGDPSNMDADNPSVNSIDLEWTEGTGGDKTIVRRKVGSYPSDYNDGFKAYFDTDNSTTNSGLAANTNYYYRGWAYDSDSAYYSDGYTSDNETTLVPENGEPPESGVPNPGVGWLGMRPEIDMTNIVAMGVPTLVKVGNYYGYSLPIYNNDNEEIYSDVAVPSRWDGESDFHTYLYVCVSNAGQSGKRFNIQLAWERYTPNEDAIPASTNNMTYELTVDSDDQYASYRLQCIVDYDIDDPNMMETHDVLGLRVRRIAASQDEIAGEVILVHTEVYFHRGDLLGEEEGMTEAMLLIFLGCLGLGFIVTGFAFKQWFLPAMSIVVFGIVAYMGRTNSEATGDLYWFVLMLGLAGAFTAIGSAFMVQSQAQKAAERQYDIDNPPQPPPLSEEEAYSKMLDEEIGKSRRVGGPARRKQMLDKATRQLYGLDRPPKE